MSSASSDCNSPSGTPFDVGPRYRLTQGLVIDYGIGLAILGLNPLTHLLTPTLIVAAIVLLKMVWDIAKRWQFRIARNPIAIGSGMLNVLGSLTIALLAWLTLIFLDTLIPLIDRFALSAAFMAGTWSLGTAINQFFLSGFLNRTTP